MIIAKEFFIKLDFNAKLRLIKSVKLCLHVLTCAYMCLHVLTCAYMCLNSVLNVRKINKCMEILPWEQTL